MARDFTNLASFGQAVSAITAQPCTIAFWMNPVASSSNGMILGPSDGTNNNRLFFQRLTNVDPVQARAVTFAAGSGSGKATTGLNVTIGQWGHWCGLFPSVASRTIFFNGTDKQTDSTGLSTLAALTTFWLAAAGTGAASAQRGIFAEIGVWNAVLADADVALLGASMYAPSLVRPANLVAYWKLDGSGATELDSAGSNNMTISGTVPQAAHPPGILYSIPVVSVGASAASQGGSVGGRRRERLARSPVPPSETRAPRRDIAPKGRAELLPRKRGEAQSVAGRTGPRRSEGIPTDEIAVGVTPDQQAFNPDPLIAAADALIAERLAEQDRLAQAMADVQAEQDAADAAEAEALAMILIAANS